MSPWLAILISFGYIMAMIGIAEGLRRWRHYGSDFTRKFIHIAVGMYSVIAVTIFDQREWAIIPPAAFIIINFLDWKYGILKAMTSSDRSNLGTVYFPISFVIIIWLFWDRPALLVGSLMPMTWGDALAAVIGRRYGRRQYTILNATRSVEGSLVMFGASALSTWLALALLGADTPLGMALVTAAGASLAESVSPWGLDNLTVPAASAALLALLAG
jgi:dolichol kinase